MVLPITALNLAIFITLLIFLFSSERVKSKNFVFAFPSERRKHTPDLRAGLTQPSAGLGFIFEN